MDNEKANLMLEAINQMGELEISHFDTALALIENQEKLANNFKKNQEALKKIVKFSDEEQRLSEDLRLKKKIESKLSEDDARLLPSVKEKEDLLEKTAMEVMGKPFKVNLKKISLENLPKGTKLWQMSALMPILKKEED